MAVVPIYDIGGDKVSEVNLTDDIFNIKVKSHILHEVVNMQLANKRSGTATVKNRSDIVGSTRKLFKQKGTGRARRGSIKSPLLRGGGVVFGPNGRNYTKKVNKKVRKLALKMALTTKYKENELLVVNEIVLDQPKTKEIKKIIDNLKLDNALFIFDKDNENVLRSARNIPKIKILNVNGLNVFDILKYKKVVILEPSVKHIEERLCS